MPTFDDEVESYIYAAHMQNDEDWASFDGEKSAATLLAIFALPETPDYYEQVHSLLSKHIEECAFKHAQQCERNGRFA